MTLNPISNVTPLPAAVGGAAMGGQAQGPAPTIVVCRAGAWIETPQGDRKGSPYKPPDGRLQEDS